MKWNRIFFVLVLSITLVLGMNCLVLGADVDKTDNNDIVFRYSPNECENAEISYSFTILDYNQAAELISTKNSIPLSEAQAVLGNQVFLTSDGPRRAISYPTYTKTFTYNGQFSVEIGGIWEAYNSGSFRQLNRLVNKWTGAASSGDYTWHEYHVTDVTPSYPATTVSLSGRGYFEVAVDTSSTTGASFGNDLLGWGFTVSSTQGTTKYYRNVKNISFTKSLY